MSILILDTSNLLYRTFFGHKETGDIDSDFALHMAFMTMNKFYKKFKPDTTILTFDGKNNWRKRYTKSVECMSEKHYKGNRRLKFTPEQERQYQRFLRHIEEFQQIMREHTAVVCMQHDEVEADDIISGIVDAYASEDEDIYIVSRDRDLTQLQGKGTDTFYPNVKQIDPFTDKFLTIEDGIKYVLKIKDPKPLDHKYVNTEYLLFCKCIRGDAGDNVQSAFPGVRRTRLNKAYDDPYEMTNLLNHKWKDPNNKEFKVGDLIKEGKLLMDLRSQPKAIRLKIFNTILEEMDNHGKFDYFKFLRFLGQYNLPKISQKAEDLIPLLDG